MAKSSTGIRGVSLDRINKLYRVFVPFGEDDTRYLASFPLDMVHLAAQMRAEAEGLTPDQYPALKEKYARLKDECANQDAIDLAAEPAEAESPITPPVSPEPDDPSPTAGINECLAAALRADEHMAALKTVADHACREAAEAEDEAIRAWDAYAEALYTLGNHPASAMSRSKLSGISM